AFSQGRRTPANLLAIVCIPVFAAEQVSRAAKVQRLKSLLQPSRATLLYSFLPRATQYAPNALGLHRKEKAGAPVLSATGRSPRSVGTAPCTEVAEVEMLSEINAHQNWRNNVKRNVTNRQQD